MNDLDTQNPSNSLLKRIGALPPIVPMIVPTRLPGIILSVSLKRSTTSKANLCSSIANTLLVLFSGFCLEVTLESPTS